MPDDLFDFASSDPCSHCGACQSYCEWDAYERAYGERADSLVCKSCMLCFRICPRAHRPDEETLRRLFGEVGDNPLFGYYREAWAAKAAQKAPGVQDAGVVTALVKFLLQEGVVDAAMLTGRDARWAPAPFIARNTEEVELAAGSKYTASPSLATLLQATENYERLVFIGTPCQIAALRNLQARGDDRCRADRVVLAIGLFCAESFSYDRLMSVVEGEMGIPVAEVTRFDIKKNNLIAYCGEKRAEKPLAELKHAAWPICHSCTDFTAELADLSVGAVGSRPDENTILVRSPCAADLIARARDQDVLELGQVRNFGIVERIAQNKHARRAELSEEESRFLLKRSIRGNFKKSMARGERN